MKYVPKRILLFRMGLIFLLFITSIFYNLLTEVFYDYLRFITIGLFIIWDMYYQKNHNDEIIEHYKQNYGLDGDALERRLEKHKKVYLPIQFYLGIGIVVITVISLGFSLKVDFLSSIKNAAVILAAFSIALFIFAEKLYNYVNPRNQENSKFLLAITRVSCIVLFLISIVIWIKVK